jgi:hypothetical protein
MRHEARRDKDVHLQQLRTALDQAAPPSAKTVHITGLGTGVK